MAFPYMQLTSTYTYTVKWSISIRVNIVNLIVNYGSYDYCYYWKKKLNVKFYLYTSSPSFVFPNNVFSIVTAIFRQYVDNSTIIIVL